MTPNTKSKKADRKPDTASAVENKFLNDKVLMMENQLFYLKHEGLEEKHQQHLNYVIKRERQRSGDQWVLGFITGAIYTLAVFLYYRRKDRIASRAFRE
jgi:hypothetical protein